MSKQDGVTVMTTTELLAGYDLHLARSPLSGQTPRTYASAVRGFLGWLETADVDGKPLDDSAAWAWAVKDYRTRLVTVDHRAPSTVNKAMAALDNFATWRGLAKADIKRQDIPARAPRALSPRATIRYLRAVEQCPRARDRAIALTPLYAGARIAEVAALDTTDAALSARKGTVRLVGKGQKSRTVPVHPKLREALQEWLSERPGWPGSDTPALFLSRLGTRLTTDAIGDVLDGITEAAGLDDGITAHVLRHTFATTMIRDGVDLVTVSQLLGHSRVETVTVYTKPTTDDLEQAIARLPSDE